MGTVIFLSGTTRGATLEGIGRSLGDGFAAMGYDFIELSLLDMAAFLEKVKAIDFRRVALVFSFVSMGMDISLRREDGTAFELWEEIGVPFISIHGDSPAYFFDRHVVKNSRFLTLYAFPEHCELRKRLPLINGPIDTTWPLALNPVPLDSVDFKAKKNGRLIFLKNGKNPQRLRHFWKLSLGTPLLEAMNDLASELTNNLDRPQQNQIDDEVTRYFTSRDFDIERLTKLRLFFIAQLDDYLRAVKCTRLAEALMDLPIEIRGNEWEHLDFTHSKAQYINECNYQKSSILIRNSLGIIDMSPNTYSRPHDRVMRAYGAHTLCLTNEQSFLEELPHGEQVSFTFDVENLKDKVQFILSHPVDAVEIGVAMAAAYNKLHPAEATIRKLIDGAALVRFNGHQQRPEGSQDFFVWSRRLP